MKAWGKMFFFLCLPSMAFGYSAHRQETTALIDELSAKQVQIQTVTANFSQRKETSLVDGALVSYGILRFRRPDRIYFAYTKPEPVEISLDGKFLWLFDPARSQAKRYPLSRGSPAGSFMESVTRIFQRTLAQLSDEYSIQPLPADRGAFVRFRLQPKTETLRRILQEVELELDKASGAIRRFRMVESTGDRLILEFENLQINQPLNDRDLQIKIPSSGQVQEKEWP